MKMKKNILLTAAFLLLGAPGFSFAMTAGEITKEVQKKYDTIKTLKADFVQVALSVGQNKGRVSNGNLVIKKPGKMRWEFQKPVGDVVVSDGKKMWIYQQDLNQVIETKIEENTPQVAMNFLAGAGSIDKDFNVELLGTVEDKFELKLTSKEGIPHINEIVLLVDKKTFVVVKTTVKDSFGGETAVEIKNVKINENVKDKLFEYKAPKGVTVMKP